LADLRYNLTRYEGSSYDPGAGVNPTTVGFSSAYAALAQDPSIPAFTGIVGGADNGGMGTTQASAYGPFDTNHDFNVSMAQMWKNHSFRYGWEYIVQQQADGSLSASSGNFSFGNAPRNESNLRAQGIDNWDLSVVKKTAITEKQTLEFRAEFFNLANHVRFQAPGTTVGSGLFGVVTSAANKPPGFRGPFAMN